MGRDLIAWSNSQNLCLEPQFPYCWYTIPSREKTPSSGHRQAQSSGKHRKNMNQNTLRRNNLNFTKFCQPHLTILTFLKWCYVKIQLRGRCCSIVKLLKFLHPTSEYGSEFQLLLLQVSLPANAPTKRTGEDTSAGSLLPTFWNPGFHPLLINILKV